MTDLETITARHFRRLDCAVCEKPADHNLCDYCGDDWPCDASQLATALAELQATGRQLRDLLDAEGDPPDEALVIVQKFESLIDRRSAAAPQTEADHE